MLAIVDEVGLAAASPSRNAVIYEKHLEGEWYDIQERAGGEEIRDRIQIPVYRTSDDSDTAYELDVGFQELYDAGFIKERTMRPPQPKNANT